MQLSGNCFLSIAKCMGGDYFTGNLRATCSRIRSSIPAPALRFATSDGAIKHACKTKDMAAFAKFHSDIAAEPSFRPIIFYEDLLYKCGKYCSLNILSRVASSSMPSVDLQCMLLGAARSGDVLIFRQVLQVFETHSCMPRRLNPSVYYYAALSGSLPISEELFPTGKKVPFYCKLEFFDGIIKKDRFELFKWFISTQEFSQREILSLFDHAASRNKDQIAQVLLDRIDIKQYFDYIVPFIPAGETTMVLTWLERKNKIAL